MTTQIDIAKQQYASELAAYTFEQFRAARRQYLRTQAAAEERQGGRNASDHRGDDEDDGDQSMARRHLDVKSTDFATRAQAKVNGTTH